MPTDKLIKAVQQSARSTDPTAVDLFIEDKAGEVRQLRVEYEHAWRAEVVFSRTPDGREKVTKRIPLRWATGEEADLRGRETVVGTDDGKEERFPVPDNLFLCDSCNTEITTRPFVIVANSHALCRACQGRWGIADGQATFVEEEVL